jgi:4-carboxymuconolactone decarboxylase
MSRLGPVPLEQMSTFQRQVHDKIAGQGRNPEGPLGVLIHVPELGERVADFVDYLMSDTLVPQKLKSIAILVIARAYTAQYEWFIHAGRARSMGIGANVIDAIRDRVRPVFSNPDEALVHDITSEIVYSRALGDELYSRAVKVFGNQALVELITVIGWYTAVAVLVVSFKMPAPGANPAPLAP